MGVGKHVSIATLPLLAAHTKSVRTQLAPHRDRGEFLYRMQLAGTSDVHCCVCWRSPSERLLFFCFLGIPYLMVSIPSHTLDNAITRCARVSDTHLISRLLDSVPTGCIRRCVWQKDSKGLHPVFHISFHTKDIPVQNDVVIASDSYLRDNSTASA